MRVQLGEYARERQGIPWSDDPPALTFDNRLCVATDIRYNRRKPYRHLLEYGVRETLVGSRSEAAHVQRAQVGHYVNDVAGENRAWSKLRTVQCGPATLQALGLLRPPPPLEPEW